MLIFLVAIAPAAALIIYFYKKDKYEKEPLKLLGKAFFAGVAATFFAMFIGGLLLPFVSSINMPALRIFFISFLVAGLVEEGFKFSALRLIIYNNEEFNEPYDGILYSVMVSLGFAALENILYVMSAYFKLGFLGLAQVGISRALFAVPAHALFGVIMGYYLGLAKFSKDKTLERKYMYQGLGLAVLLHGLYDFFVFTSTVLGVVYVIVLLIICWNFSLKAMKAHLQESPFKRD